MIPIRMTNWLIILIAVRANLVNNLYVIPIVNTIGINIKDNTSVVDIDDEYLKRCTNTCFVNNKIYSQRETDSHVILYL